MVEQFSSLLAGYGVPPLIGGMLIGVVFGFLMRGWLRSGPVPVAKPGAGMVRDLTRAHLGTAPLLDSQNIPPDVQAEILDSLHSGHKIEAIKRLREQTGLGLKECKDLVDALDIEPGR